MENDPREMELNFKCSSERSGAESSENPPADNLVFAELEPENAIADSSKNSTNLFAESNEDSMGEIKPDFQLESTSAKPAVSSAAGDVASDVLRSRQPMNRPAGTPPLENAPSNERISAAELVIVGKSYGPALRVLREQSQLSHKDIEQATLIQTHYLEALENENLKVLPPLVYVIAFIRTLSRFYNLSSETADQMVAKLKTQLEYTCNDEVMNSLDVDSTGAEVNERRMKRIMLGLVGIVVLVAVMVTAVVLLIRDSGQVEVTIVDNPSAREHFDPNTVYPLLEPPALDLPKLPVAE